MSLFSKINDGLRKTRESMSGAIDSVLKGFKKIDDELFEELEEILIMSDVGMPTTEKIIEELKKRVKEEKIKEASEVKDEIRDIVEEMISGGEEMNINTKPSIILMIGVNGVGKTTTIGKLAMKYKTEGKKVILGAADTFRAAAIEQLEVWAQRADVDMVKHSEGADPAAVVFDTIAAGKSRGADIIICDTAGRLHNKKNLMDELNKISRIIERELPEADKEILLVLDATTGQNAVNQAEQFREAAGITGIVLTKLDGTAKGGVVIAIRENLQIPVKYIGVGEGIDDLQTFSAHDFAQALFVGAADNESAEAEETLEAEAEQEEAAEAEEGYADEPEDTDEEISFINEDDFPPYATPEYEAEMIEELPEQQELTFVLASKNEKKLEEMRRILEPMAINVVTAEEMGFAEEVAEDGSSFEENAKIKAEAVCKALNMPAIADDSGLCVDALGGAPGIYSARYSGGDDEDNNDKLLEELKDVPKYERTARYVCAICLAMPDGRSLEVRGECEGLIGYKRKGDNGFGYDPLFIVDTGLFSKTMAQLSPAKKDKISHRGNALKKLSEQLPEFLGDNDDE